MRLGVGFSTFLLGFLCSAGLVFSGSLLCFQIRLLGLSGALLRLIRLGLLGGLLTLVRLGLSGRLLRIIRLGRSG